MFKILSLILLLYRTPCLDFDLEGLCSALRFFILSFPASFPLWPLSAGDLRVLDLTRLLSGRLSDSSRTLRRDRNSSVMASSSLSIGMYDTNGPSLRVSTLKRTKLSLCPRISLAYLIGESRRYLMLPLSSESSMSPIISKSSSLNVHLSLMFLSKDTERQLGLNISSRLSPKRTVIYMACDVLTSPALKKMGQLVPVFAVFSVTGHLLTYFQLTQTQTQW